LTIALIAWMTLTLLAVSSGCAGRFGSPNSRRHSASLRPLPWPFETAEQLTRFADLLFDECTMEGKLRRDVLARALTGYFNIRAERPVTSRIAIVDYDLPSIERRLFVLDLVERRLLHWTLVAHGRNSGEDLATDFSNQDGSLKSCLGFLQAAETYQGSNGYSLNLDGLEPAFNDLARKRPIVMHGADYVSEAFIAEHGRLGRSWGCPAVPQEESSNVIDAIRNGGCVFIHASDPSYLAGSLLLRSPWEQRANGHADG